MFRTVRMRPSCHPPTFYTLDATSCPKERGNKCLRCRALKHSPVREVKKFRPIGKLTFPIFPRANSAGTLFASSQFSCAISESCTRVITSNTYGAR
jgi:hypothetical protein